MIILKLQLQDFVETVMSEFYWRSTFSLVRATEEVWQEFGRGVYLLVLKYVPNTLQAPMLRYLCIPGSRISWEKLARECYLTSDDSERVQEEFDSLRCRFFFPLFEQLVAGTPPANTPAAATAISATMMKEIPIILEVY